jgi:drug/metabolite transporter (DMT)-like permease
MRNREDVSALAANLSLLGAMFLWASSFPVMKYAIGFYHPFVVVFGRLAVASVLFALLISRSGFRVQKGDWRAIGLLVLFEPCLYFVFEGLALEYTSSAQAGMITAILPLIVAVGGWLLLKERVGVRTMTGFVLAMAGVVWLTLAGDADISAPRPVLGNFLEFMAMIMASGYILSVRKLTARYSPWFLTALQSFGGAIFFAPLLAWPGVEVVGTLAWAPILCIVYLGGVISIGAYGLYNLGVSRLPAHQASAYINLIPVFTVIMGRIFLGETMNSLQYTAAFLVIAGVFLSQEYISPRRRRFK